MVRALISVTTISVLALQGCKSTGTSGTTSGQVSSRLGINAPGGWSDSPFISRDGKRLYFMYSRYNFGQWIKGGMVGTPVVTGPDRPGLHKSANAFDESDIYMAIRNADGSWSEPVNLGFNGAFGDSSGMEINDGNTFIWLQGNGATNNIVMANKGPNGSWGTPVDLGPEINLHTSGTVQDNPHLSPDGKGIWFVSNRAGGAGKKDLWFSSNPSGSIFGTWSTPVNVGAPVNTADDEDQVWISPVSSDVYWNGSQGIMHCMTDGSSMCASTSAPARVVIPGCDFAAEVSMPDDGNSIYFGCVNATTFAIKIMYSVKQPGGAWGPATPVD